MDASAIARQVKTDLKDRGFSATTCPIGRLADLKQDLEAPLKQGLIGEDFFGERLSFFKLSPRDYRQGLKTIIITAAPQPSQEAVFHYRGREHRYPVPPTYAGQTNEIIEKIITAAIEPHGYGLFPAWIPVKIAAVRTGLARYGRNNITYHDGRGSYFKLKAFLTDLPADADPWRELELMPECEDCRACLKSCPTGAIRADRVLLQAARCLTHLNERPNPFPSWVKKSWHHALIGCMRCQLVCPMNDNNTLRPDNTVTFTEEETQQMLDAGGQPGLPDSVITKLEALSLGEDAPLVARNLKAMLG